MTGQIPNAALHASSVLHDPRPDDRGRDLPGTRVIDVLCKKV
jgi:hypothetical protein